MIFLAVHQPTQPAPPPDQMDHVVPENPVLILDKASVSASDPSSSRVKIQSREDLPKSQHSDNWSLVPSWARATLRHRNPERKREKQESRVSSGESTSDGNSLELKETDPNITARGLRGTQDKPLPTIPSGVVDRARQFIPQVSSLSENDARPHRLRHLPALPEMGFSFRPGDDASILSPRLLEDELEGPTSPNARGRTRSTDRERLGSSSRAQNLETRASKQPETKPKSSSTGTSILHISGEFRETYSTLSREGSTSSVVTAVRDSSVRSTPSTEIIAQAGRPISERGIGSAIGEAVAAAAKALAKGGRGSPGDSEPTSAASHESSDVEGQVQDKGERSTGSTSNIGWNKETRRGS